MAFFELSEQSEVAVFWFVARRDLDWMAMVFRDGPSAPWKAVLRFRYVVDEKDPFESADKKSGYQIVQDPTEVAKQKLVAVMDQAAEMMAIGDARVTRHEVNGPSEAFVRWYAQQEFAHVRAQAPEPQQVQ